ncbi:hypothetical protein LINPERPRIM_LOCUS37247 [Linum perenne]
MKSRGDHTIVIASVPFTNQIVIAPKFATYRRACHFQRRREVFGHDSRCVDFELNYSFSIFINTSHDQMVIKDAAELK